MSFTKNNKKQLDWTVEALEDRDAIWLYIAANSYSPTSATMVDIRIIQTAERLSAFPQSGKLFKADLRLAFVTKTQYTIVYKITENSVRILRVSHQKKKTP